jgi:catechol-2,3-dioxygenase
VTITLQDPGDMCDFMQTVLDFRISDDFNAGFFLRCNVDHHGIGLFPGPPKLHHHAWEVSSAVELGQVGDRVDEAGGSLLLGPARHGAGDNIAVYYLEPSGAVVEYYCDMLRIYDEAAYEPVQWDLTSHKWFSRWAPMMPDGFLELGVPVPEATVRS